MMTFFLPAGYRGVKTMKIKEWVLILALFPLLGTPLTSSMWKCQQCIQGSAEQIDVILFVHLFVRVTGISFFFKASRVLEWPQFSLKASKWVPKTQSCIWWSLIPTQGVLEHFINSLLSAAARTLAHSDLDETNKRVCCVWNESIRP